MPPLRSAITAAIDSAFNAILLEAFFCGLYTLLFAYTLRLLLLKKNKKFYAAALTLLWVLVMLAFSFDWQFHRTAFVLDNNSPIDIANGVIGVTNVKSLAILDNTFSVSCNWLADALLIWRCYILWDDKKWMLLPLSVLLLSDVVLGVVSVISAVTPISKNDSNIFVVSFFAVSIVITMIGTLLIILRILLVTEKSPLTPHISTYRKIQRIIVESGIVYTIAMFIAGVGTSIELTGNTRASILVRYLVTYSEAILVPLSGIGPTLIAMRVESDTSTQTDAGAVRTRSRSGVLSHLTFRRTIGQNDNFDISADEGSGHGNSPLESSIRRESNNGDNEKT